MATEQTQWSSRYIFLLASIGSTVGLSNIWKFTYLAGENGGGAFVLIYLVSLLVMGIPILAAELMLGRRGGKSLLGTMEVLSARDGIHRTWRIFGWAGMITVFLVLGFYCVIAGWTMDYTFFSLTGKLEGSTADSAVRHFNILMDSPLRMTVWLALFVLLNIWVVSKGLQEGLERSLGWMTPALFVLLVGLVIFAAVTSSFREGVSFLFTPDYSRITLHVVWVAFGQAFFSLGIGVGVMLTYGAYMQKQTPILSSAAIIAFSDGFASVLAGLAIFPIVFAHGLSPTEGPGLLFMTLPIAFDQMAGGGLAGALFFLLLFFAAFTSSISLLESIVAHFTGRGVSRVKATVWTSVALFVTGLGTVFSFNLWSEFHPLGFVPGLSGLTIFGTLDFLASNLLMPFGGIAMAVLAGWSLPTSASRTELDVQEGWFRTWHFLVRYVAPLAVLCILLSGLGL